MAIMSFKCYMCIICVSYVYYIYMCVSLSLNYSDVENVKWCPGLDPQDAKGQGAAAARLARDSGRSPWTRCGTHVVGHTFDMLRHLSTSFDMSMSETGAWRIETCRDMSRHRTVTCWRCADVSWHLALCRDALWRLWRLRGAPRGALEVSSRSSESRLACAAAGAANPIEKKLLQPANLPEFATGCDWMWLPSMRNMSITWKAMQVQG
jgi:hypothetical protein